MFRAAAQPSTEQAGSSPESASPANASEQPAAQGAAGAEAAGTGAAGTQEDVLIAVVNGTEIRRSDVDSAVSLLPPQFQQLPAEMVLSAALDMVVSRQLILDQASAQELENDPEVQQLIAPVVENLTNQAIVQVWMQRQMEEMLTEERIQQAFDAYRTANPGQEVTLEQLRPQLESELRRQLSQELIAGLRESADITLYGPGGEELQPTEAPAEGENPEQNEGEASETTSEPAGSDQQPEGEAAPQ